MKPAGLVVATAALLFTTGAWSGEPAGRFDTRLPSDKQAIHVLNRLTYGARPGDVAEVRRIGVEAWIRRQLQPAAIAENPALEPRLRPLATLQRPTWQLLEDVQKLQPPPLLLVPDLAQLLPPEQSAVLMSPTTAPEQRRAMLASYGAELRPQVLAALPQNLFEDLPELREEARSAREEQTRKLSGQLNEFIRRQRPSITQLLTRDQQQVMRSGTDAEKTTLIESLDGEKRQQVVRAVGLYASVTLSGLNVPSGMMASLPSLPAAYQREAMMLNNPQQAIVNDVIEGKLQRALLSNRQLEEVLVDFWFNHFNVSISKPPVRTLLPSYERDAIRPYVLGRFRDMLLATARHPAMLFYLDNHLSAAPRTEAPPAAAARPGPRPPGLNENYGRELMELHTLGVGAGYTQADVVNVARAFTGWTIYDLNRTAEYQFNPAHHDRDEKVVLGKVFPRGGSEEEGVRVIEQLASHPATARFISRKLAQRFVADDPPPALVERMAATFTKTGGDLRAVMETLLLSREFLSEGAWRSKVKSPLEMVVGSLRALNAEVTNASAIAQRIAELGQPLYAKVEPTGYANTGEAWASSAGLLGRMNFASALLAGQIPGVKVNPDAIAAAGFGRALPELTGAEASTAAIEALRVAGNGRPPAPALVATVLISSPDFQRK